MKILKAIAILLLISTAFFLGNRPREVKETIRTKFVQTRPLEERPVFGWPIDEEDYIALSSPKGYREPAEIGGYDIGDHRGVDLFGAWHSRINSIDNGLVVEHYPPPNGFYGGHPVLGGYIVVLHRNGFTSHYGHLSKTYVHEGDYVSRGQLIGRQGATGRTDAEHLHLELELYGELVNALRYLREPR